MPKPAQTFVFIDENDASIDDGLFQIDRSPGASWGSIPSDRHSQGCNISFADGRVEYWKWKSPKAYNGWGQGTGSAGDLEDLRRLQSVLGVR